ncbi:MAG: hypothetical protein ACYSU3_20470 [Planctomycetota bacterium]|jgi:hypothetical protein
MRPAENIKRLVKNARIQINPEVKKSALKELINEFQKSKNTGLAGTKLNIWRIIMNSKITKLATVAVVILAIVVGVTLIDKSATPTYAIEQTIEAMRSISSVRAYISDGEVLFQINSRKNLLLLQR